LILTCVRFADRDMLMRYHWGLGIGHMYSHEHHSHPSHSIPADLIEPDDTSEERTNDPDLHPMEWDDGNGKPATGSEGGPMEVDDPELGLEERDKEPELEWDSEFELGPNEDELSEISDEDLELHSTYEIDY
jgi:hypothetical protein